MHTIETLMTRAAVAVRDTLPSRVVARYMAEHDLRHVVVVDEHARLVGIVADEDLDVLRATDDETTDDEADGDEAPDVADRPIAERCRPAVLARRTDLVVHALARMIDRRHDAVVVVDAQGRPIGLVTDEHLLALAAVCVPPWTRVGEVASRLVSRLRKDTRIGDALWWMRGQGHRHAPVLLGGGRIGVVAHRDLASRPVEAWTAAVGTLAQSAPPALERTDPLSRAMQALGDGRVGCVPIVEGGRLVAMVTMKDILRALLGALLRSTARPAEVLDRAAPATP